VDWKLLYALLAGNAPAFSAADTRKARLLVAAVTVVLTYVLWVLVIWLLGGYGPKFGADVRGVVTISGNPAPHGMIVFNPVDGGPISASVIYPSGKYRVTTAGHRSLAPGDYIVTIAIVDDGGNHTQTPSAAALQSLIDPRYSSKETSGLMSTVKLGRNTLSFDLMPPKENISTP
jgi:hypothetical protein